MRRPLPFPFALKTLLVFSLTMLTFSCSKGPAPDLRTAFAPCADSPNCVSSDARDQRHAIAPLLLKTRTEDEWRQIRDSVFTLPRTKLLRERGNYLRAECRSAVFGFVDDLEVQLRLEDGIVAVRSASRTGYYDFGVNRRRVEKLRGLLKERGLLLEKAAP